ncbi:caprin-1, partial [Salvelinus sp. IW2-2015]|uniref:caprin-1 n=1 Tax=Salvelinus sp. IW2-2015 TaxID=2691554 RepID=UPI0038D48B00
DKALKDSLDRVLLSGCFDQAQSHQNGVCEETEEKTVALVEKTVALVEETEEKAVDPEGEIVEEYIEPIEVEATEFVNRQFILDTTYSDKEQGDEWTTETEAVSTILQQPVQSAPPPITTEAHPLNGATPPGTPPADPVVRKQEVQNLLSQMQGPYNFMQPSFLPIQVSLPSEQPPGSSQTQPVNGPKPPHSSGINVNAPPFQSMQTVFNLNAPVPPANETEALTQASQYPNSYSQQGFSSQSQQLPVEQTEMQTEQLQSVVGAFHSQDLSLPSQDLSLPSQDLSQGQQLSQQGPGFGPGVSRQAQSFYNSRGMTRGGPRNARGLANGYRGYDSYRPPFTNTPNSGYQQAQFNTPRDYSNGGNYQRGEGYNQNYKRGAGQGPRGVSRGGNAQAMKS